MEKLNFTFTLSINTMLKYAIFVFILLSIAISTRLIDKSIIFGEVTKSTILDINLYDESSIMKIAHTKISRVDFAKKIKPMLEYYITENEYDKLFSNLTTKDIGIILTGLMITETSTQMVDG